MINLIPTSLISSFNFETYKVDRELLPWIQSVWSFSNKNDSFISREKFYPDGCTSLLINFTSQGPVITVEFNKAVFYKNISSDTPVVSARFNPGAFYLFLPPEALPAKGLALTIGTDITPYWYHSLCNVVDAMPSDDMQQCAIALQAWILEQVKTNQPSFGNGVRLARAIQTSNLSVEALGSKLGMTRRTLERQLKNEVGYSPKEMINIQRMQQARRLLCKPDTSVSDIALRCGFFDQAHFSHAFKKYTLETPLSYKKRKLSHFYN